MKLTLALALILAVFINVSQQQGNDGSTTIDDRLERIVRAADEHYGTSSTGLSRRKRAAKDSFKRKVLKVLQECFRDRPDPTVLPVSSTTTHPPVGGPCSSPDTVEFTEAWRKDNLGSNIKPHNNGTSYNCDAQHFNNITWFRITGSAGKWIRDSCSPPYSCGSHAGMWTNATMPTAIGQPVLLPLYGSWSGNCFWYPFRVPKPLTAMRCSAAEGDLVYKIDGFTGCHNTVCTME